MTLVVRSEQRCFGGVQGFYEHESTICAGPMRFAVYLPPRALAGERVPALYFLAGLSCTEETFVIKAGAQRVASELGLAIITCDTSPRVARFPGDDAHWDFGLGAGFYLDATTQPWARAYRMESYVTKELRSMIEAHFLVRDDVRGIFGHSMGGHGALTLALRHPGLYSSVSAFAPIVSPCEVPWGQKAFRGYLGDGADEQLAWAEHDASKLVVRNSLRFKLPEILIDQGTSDKFLGTELLPDRFQAACAAAEQPLLLRMQEGYDHSYYFIASFVEDHLRHHARLLMK